MYKITRKRVVRQVREKATSYRGARVRENVTHNATITGMDRHENVLVVSNGYSIVILRALKLLLAAQEIMGVSGMSDVATTHNVIKAVTEAFAVNPTIPPEA